MNLKKITKNAFLGIGVFAIGVYRLGGPFIEETDQMEKEAEKLGKEIQQVRLDAAHYDKAWEKKIEDADRKVKERLPDKTNSSEVLDYFVTQFDREHPGTIAFISATQSSVTPVSFGLQGAPNSQPRAARYRFEASMHQTMLIPYMEHMEQYNGLYRLNDFTFDVPQDKGQSDTLKANLFFEFYLAPLDWVPPEKLAEAKKETTSTGDSNQFRGVFVSQPITNTPAPAQNVARIIHRGTASAAKPPKLDRMVGTSVVHDESIYEEGDSIGNWKILRVDPRSKSVTLKNGSTVKTVVVK